MRAVESRHELSSLKAAPGGPATVPTVGLLHPPLPFGAALRNERGHRPAARMSECHSDDAGATPAGRSILTVAPLL